MSASFVEQLNLTPQERRIVVVIAVVVFVVLNILLVLPHFGDLGKVKDELDKTRNTIETENKVVLKDIDPVNGNQKKLKELQQNQGGGIGNQQIQLQRSISDQAMKTGVGVDEIRPISLMNTASNAFYEEQSVKISFECQESNLINFLYNVGNDPAMIRVRELNLRTADANRYRLRGDATLSANYARAQPKPAAPAAAKTGAPPAKPGVPPSKPVPPGPAQKSLQKPQNPANPKKGPPLPLGRKNT